jgi:transcriptional regulator with XRE-family HTH domain
MRARLREPNRLYVARTRALLSQKELADRAGICVRSVTRIELGQARPQLRNVRRILEALGLSIEQAEQVFPRIAKRRIVR